MDSSCSTTQTLHMLSRAINGSWLPKFTRPQELLARHLGFLLSFPELGEGDAFRPRYLINRMFLKRLEEHPDGLPPTVNWLMLLIRAAQVSISSCYFP